MRWYGIYRLAGVMLVHGRNGAAEETGDMIQTRQFPEGTGILLSRILHDDLIDAKIILYAQIYNFCPKTLQSLSHYLSFQWLGPLYKRWGLGKCIRNELQSPTLVPKIDVFSFRIPARKTNTNKSRNLWGAHSGPCGTTVGWRSL